MNKNKPTFVFNFNAPVGQNIANVEHLEAHFDKDTTMQIMNLEETTQQKTETAQQRTINEEELAKYFISSFRGMGSGNTNFFNILIDRLKDDYSEQDFCRIAVLIYESKTLNNNKPHTFKDWYKIFCQLVNCPYNENREPRKHQPTESIKNIFYFIQ